MELIDHLTRELGIREDQARGGAGALLNLARQRLGGEFGKVEQHIPEAGQLADQAPAPAGGTGGLGGILGNLGGLAGGGGGGGGLGGLAGLAALAPTLSKLGLNPDQIARFAPAVLGFLESRGGGGAKAQLERALHHGP